MKIAELKKKFKNTWVLAEVLKENELNQPVEAKLIATGDDPDKLYDRMAKLSKNKTFTAFYTGKIEGIYTFNAVNHF